MVDSQFRSVCLRRHLFGDPTKNIRVQVKDLGYMFESLNYYIHPQVFYRWHSERRDGLRA